MTPHFLFVCGRNKWRSPTAVAIYNNDPRLSVRSAGMSVKSAHQISQDDIQWADLILVMERSHASRIRATFCDLQLPRIECLEIPDDYEYMDAELVELIKTGVEYHIQQFNKR